MTALALVQSTASGDRADARVRLVALVKTAAGIRDRVEAGLAIAADPALKAVAVDMLKRLEAEQTLASDVEAVRELRPLLAVFHVADGKNKNWNDFWSIYCRALDDLPVSTIRAGVDKFIKETTTDYFPKPGVLRELCLARESELASVRATLAFGIRAEPMPEGVGEHRRERLIDIATRAFLADRAAAAAAPKTKQPPDVGFV